MRHPEVVAAYLLRDLEREAEERESLTLRPTFDEQETPDLKPCMNCDGWDQECEGCEFE